MSIRHGWGPIAAVVVLALSAVIVAPNLNAKPKLRELRTHAIAVRARDIGGFERGDPSRTRFGRLIWLGGVALTSNSPFFGGFSGLAIGRKGERFVAVSDAGFWLTGRIEGKPEQPVAITDTKVGPLVARSGRTLRGVREVDAEAVRLVSGSMSEGRLLISFERLHRIARFKINGKGVIGPPSYLRLPGYVRGLKQNRGIESVAHLQAGRAKGATIAFAEGRRDARGHLRGWLIRGGRSSEIFLKAMGGFDITDAAGLPDGGLIVLERRFRWSEGIKMRLRRIPARAIRPGAVMTGEVLLEADQNYNIDNMEGVAVHRSANGQTIISLISDDNFRFFQRTLLMRFAIAKSAR